MSFLCPLVLSEGLMDEQGCKMYDFSGVTSDPFPCVLYKIPIKNMHGKQNPKKSGLSENMLIFFLTAA